MPMEEEEVVAHHLQILLECKSLKTTGIRTMVRLERSRFILFDIAWSFGDLRIFELVIEDR